LPDVEARVAAGDTKRLRLYGASHVALRLGNVYGTRQMPHGEAGVVAIFMGLLHDGGTPTIFGDGSQTRDYVYVGDVANAMLLAVEQDGGVFNIGAGVAGRSSPCRRRRTGRASSSPTPASAARLEGERVCPVGATGWHGRRRIPTVPARTSL
jgi:UDP-glucose 4-epimerase